MAHDFPSRTGTDDRIGPDSWRILEAARYLGQCHRHQRSFAVLTGPDVVQIRLAIDNFVNALPEGCRIARILAPTDSGHAFLEAILAQLGFDPFESTADDLQRLLSVVLRQGTDKRQGTVIVAADAQDFGPRVFETMRELARNSRDISPPPLIVLAGQAVLNRVLDSKGMTSVSHLTRARFDMAGGAQSRTSHADVTASADVEPGKSDDTCPTPTLELSLNQEIVGKFPFERDRLLIGRSQHCDICIASRFVSRQHALLIRSPAGDWLIDLKSTNGTSVNSQLVEQRQLIHGDVISIGNHRLRYQNFGGRALVAPIRPNRDQLNETMVMRSLRALQGSPQSATGAGDNASTAA